MKDKLPSLGAIFIVLNVVFIAIVAAYLNSRSSSDIRTKATSTQVVEIASWSFSPTTIQPWELHGASLASTELPTAALIPSSANTPIRLTLNKQSIGVSHGEKTLSMELQTASPAAGISVTASYTYKFKGQNPGDQNITLTPKPDDANIYTAVLPLITGATIDSLTLEVSEVPKNEVVYIPWIKITTPVNR